MPHDLSTCPYDITGVTLTHFFDATGMPCPMPLLKAKIALREVGTGDSLYLIASDKNSQNDLVAFCQKQHHTVLTWHTPDDDMGKTSDTTFHFIITKMA